MGKTKKKQNKKETKKKKPQQTTPSVQKSIKPPEIPTHALINMERLKGERASFTKDHIIKLSDIPKLMNSIPIPIKKLTQAERLQYLKDMKVEKTNRSEIQKRKVVKINEPFDLVEMYRHDDVKFYVLTGLHYIDFIDLVSLLECQTVLFQGSINVSQCRFVRNSSLSIPQLSAHHKLTIESIIFIFIVYVRTGLDFVKLFCFLNLESVSPNSKRNGKSLKNYIKTNKSRMCSFVKDAIKTFVDRYSDKIERDFIRQVSNSEETNLPMAIGMSVNDVCICPELLCAYRIIDSKTVRSTTNWIRKVDGSNKIVKMKNTDLYAKKVNGSGYKFEIAINKGCFVTNVLSTAGKISDLKMSILGGTGSYNYGTVLADGGYKQNDYHSVVTTLDKTCVKTEEDERFRDIFNSTFTQARNPVECVFGTMSTLFGLLKTIYIHDKTFFSPIIKCICGLYNFYLIKGPIRNDLLENEINQILLARIQPSSILTESLKEENMKCNAIDLLDLNATKKSKEYLHSSNTTLSHSQMTPAMVFGYKNGINHPITQMEKLYLNNLNQFLHQTSLN